MSFEQLALHHKILKALEELGYETPTLVQEKVIPKVLKGHDIRASAQTGTGKTAAFLLPALERLMTPSTKPGKGPRILILAPTRELAMQITSQAEKYGKYLNRLKVVCLMGGVPYPMQIRNLKQPYEILVATPGRLQDFIDRGTVKFSRLEMLVIDEADRMLDMGFAEPVEKIVSITPETRQTLLFSATLKGSVVQLSDRLMNKPMEIHAHAKKEKHENIFQKLHFVDNLPHKNRLLDHVLKDVSEGHAIVFTSTKRHADQLVGELKEKGHRAAALHGDMNQRQRTRAINGLRKGAFNILVATDVAARGIDVPSITHVINFDLPQNGEDYVHRIGRTGRAGANGTALSFAAKRETSLVKQIEKYTGQTIAITTVEGLEPRTTEAPSTKKKRFHPRPYSQKKFRPKPKFSRR